jgi:hypothetical protein
MVCTSSNQTLGDVPSDDLLIRADLTGLKVDDLEALNT